MPDESFIDKLERIWKGVEKSATVLKQVDDLAKELSPTDPNPDSVDDNADRKSEEKEETEP